MKTFTKELIVAIAKKYGFKIEEGTEEEDKCHFLFLKVNGDDGYICFQREDKDVAWKLSSTSLMFEDYKINSKSKIDSLIKILNLILEVLKEIRLRA